MKQRVIDRLEVERDRAAAHLRTAEHKLWKAASQGVIEHAFALTRHYDGQVVAFNIALDILRDEQRQEDAAQDSEKS